MKKYFYPILVLLVPVLCRAQDSQFSQYYSAPMHLSPSFAGSTGGGRMSGLYRMQWPFVKTYNTTSLSVDYNLPLLSSGIGLMVYDELAGTSALRRTSFAGCYSYNVGLTRRLFFRPGISLSYNRIGIDFKNMTFGDQMFFKLPETQEVPPASSRGYIDASASVMLFSMKYWGGVTVDHLLTPNESLTSSQSNVPIKARVFGGGKVDLNGRLGRDNEESVTYSFLYRAQAKFDQLDVGLYYTKIPLIIGAWYRGIPVFKKNADNGVNQDAFVIIIGYKKKFYSIGYSYDVTVSRLFLDSGGAHELSLQWLFLQDHEAKKREKRVVVPCPRF